MQQLEAAAQVLSAAVRTATAEMNDAANEVILPQVAYHSRNPYQILADIHAEVSAATRKANAAAFMEPKMDEQSTSTPVPAETAPAWFTTYMDNFEPRIVEKVADAVMEKLHNDRLTLKRRRKPREPEEPVAEAVEPAPELPESHDTRPIRMTSRERCALRERRSALLRGAAVPTSPFYRQNVPYIKRGYARGRLDVTVPGTSLDGEVAVALPAAPQQVLPHPKNTQSSEIKQGKKRAIKPFVPAGLRYSNCGCANEEPLGPYVDAHMRMARPIPVNAQGRPVKPDVTPQYRYSFTDQAQEVGVRSLTMQENNKNSGGEQQVQPLIELWNCGGSDMANCLMVPQAGAEGCSNSEVEAIEMDEGESRSIHTTSDISELECFEVLPELEKQAILAGHLDTISARLMGSMTASGFMSNPSTSSQSASNASSMTASGFVMPPRSPPCFDLARPLSDDQADETARSRTSSFSMLSVSTLKADEQNIDDEELAAGDWLDVGATSATNVVEVISSDEDASHNVVFGRDDTLHEDLDRICSEKETRSLPEQVEALNLATTSSYITHVDSTPVAEPNVEALNLATTSSCATLVDVTPVAEPNSPCPVCTNNPTVAALKYKLEDMGFDYNRIDHTQVHKFLHLSDNEALDSLLDYLCDNSYWLV